MAIQRFSEDWVTNLLQEAGEKKSAAHAIEEFQEKQRAMRASEFYPRPVTRSQFLRPGRFSHFVQGGALAGIVVVLCAATSNRALAPAPQTTSMINNAPDKAYYPADRFVGAGTVADYRSLPVNLSDMPRYKVSCPVKQAP